MKLSDARISLLLVLFLAAPAAIADSVPEDRLQPDVAVQAASELAELLRDSCVFPEIGLRYSEALEERVDEGFDPAGIDLAEFAGELDSIVNQVHQDAHLRVRQSPGSGGAIGTTAWIDDDIACLELLGLPDGQASQDAMADFLDQHRGARALVIDARMCPGGTLPVIDVLSLRLFSEPTHLVTMEMRAGANEQLRQHLDELPSTLRVDSEATLEGIAVAPAGARDTTLRGNVEHATGTGLMSVDDYL